MKSFTQQLTVQKTTLQLALRQENWKPVYKLFTPFRVLKVCNGQVQTYLPGIRKRKKKKRTNLSFFLHEKYISLVLNTTLTFSPKIIDNNSPKYIIKLRRWKLGEACGKRGKCPQYLLKEILSAGKILEKGHANLIGYKSKSKIRTNWGYFPGLIVGIPIKVN